MKKVLSVLVIAAMICSMIAVSASAVDMHYTSFSADQDLTGIFDGYNGDYLKVEDGKMYFENIVFQMAYQSFEDDPDTEDKENGTFDPAGAVIWSTFDLTIKLTVAYNGDNEVDDFGIPLGEDGKREAKFINFAYVEDNNRPLILHKTGEDTDGNAIYEEDASRQFLKVGMDFQNQEISLGDGGGAGRTTDCMIDDPKDFELKMGADVEYELGMSIEAGHARYFINGQLVYEINDTANEYNIGGDRGSFFMWNEGGKITISEFQVAEAGTLYPAGAGTGAAPTPDDGGDEGTEAPVETQAPAETVEDNTPPAQDNAPTTGDAMFIAVAVAVVSFGAAIVVKKVSVR